jgi:hypothetical protein
MIRGFWIYVTCVLACGREVSYQGIPMVSVALLYGRAVSCLGTPMVYVALLSATWI